MAFDPPVVFEDEPDPLGVLEGRTTPTSRTPLDAANLNGSITALGEYVDEQVADTLRLGTTSTTALRGDTALLALGTTSTTALRGDYSPPADAAAGTASMRRLGTGSTQACAGDDARLSDSRTPGGTAGGSLTGSYPNPGVADGAVQGRHVSSTLKPSGSATDSTEALRALGSSAGQAAPGASAVGRVAHGATAGTARPAGYALIVWVGSVEPTNRASGDLWVRTA